MAVNETIVTGRKFRKLIDAANKQWQRISFWHKASDCEFDDGDTAETKVGAIKGITTDLNTTTTGYAADMTTVASLNSSLGAVVSNIYVGSDGKLHKVVGGADTALNFSSNITYIGGGSNNYSYTFTFTSNYSKVLVVEYESSQTNANEYHYSSSINSNTMLCTLASSGARGGHVRLYTNVKSGDYIKLYGYDSDNLVSIYCFAL